MFVGRPLLLSALLPAVRHRPRCLSSVHASALRSELPEWAIAPQEPAEEWVACTLSHLEVAELLTLRDRAPAGAELLVVDAPGLTSDLGLRRPSAVELTASHARLRFGDDAPAACVEWSFLARIAKKRKEGAWQCAAICDERPEQISGISEVTRRTATLLPVADGPPTAVLGGFNMHRIKGIGPGEDTARKLGALGTAKGGLRGAVLDVCTGLGYTALGAARTPNVDAVVTIEIDPLMVMLQRSNPWSAELFEHEKVVRLLGDATEVVPALPDGAFKFVVHDPPANAMSGELYSEAFYSELRRVLQEGGTLYHYVGDPASKASGKLFKGILERLRAAGFREAKKDKDAYGVVARC